MIAVLVALGLVAVYAAYLFADRGGLRQRLADQVEVMRQLRAEHREMIETLSEARREAYALRRDGFQAGAKAKVQEAPDLDATGLARAEAMLTERRSDVAFIQNMAADIVKRTGVSEADALAEARRMRQELKMEDPPT